MNSTGTDDSDDDDIIIIITIITIVIIAITLVLPRDANRVFASHSVNIFALHNLTSQCCSKLV